MDINDLKTAEKTYGTRQWKDILVNYRGFISVGKKDI